MVTSPKSTFHLLRFCRPLRVFVFVYLCICICVFVCVYLYLCISISFFCICVFVFVYLCRPARMFVYLGRSLLGAYLQCLVL